MLLWIAHVVRAQGGATWSTLFGCRVLARDLGIGAAAAVAVYGLQAVINIVIVSRLGAIPDDSVWKQLGSRLDPAAFGVVALLAVVTAPIIEEVVFRAMLLRSLAARLGVADRIAVASVIFGVGHLSASVSWQTNLMMLVLTGVFGAAMCLLARATGRLGPGLVAHTLTNAGAFSFLFAQLFA
jgi:membrane protease YdiL (CAAX protease family)